MNMAENTYQGGRYDGLEYLDVDYRPVRRRRRRRETGWQRFRRTMKKRTRRFLRRNLATIIVVGLLSIGVAAGLFVGTKVSNYAQSIKLNDYGRNQTFTTYTVKGGDTIWGIAADLAALNPEYNDIRQYVAAIEKLNKIYDGHIEAGQTILIPYFIGPDGEVSHDEIYSKYGIGQ